MKNMLLYTIILVSSTLLFGCASRQQKLSVISKEPSMDGYRFGAEPQKTTLNHGGRAYKEHLETLQAMDFDHELNLKQMEIKVKEAEVAKELGIASVPAVSANQVPAQQTNTVSAQVAPQALYSAQPTHTWSSSVPQQQYQSAPVQSSYQDFDRMGDPLANAKLQTALMREQAQQARLVQQMQRSYYSGSRLSYGGYGYSRPYYGSSRSIYSGSVSFGSRSSHHHPTTRVIVVKQASKPAPKVVTRPTTVRQPRPSR